MVGSQPRPALHEATFRLLRERFHDRFGLWFHDDLRFLMELRLGPRLALHGLHDFEAYHRFLRLDPRGPSELLDAAEVMTTNETYFFREPAQLEAFQGEILPTLARLRSGDRRLRVWSAGCSSGEEAFTIAILLRGSGLFPGWDLEVFGSDIARKVLAVARSAHYGPHAFRGVEAETLLRWFQPVGEKWTLDAPIRRMVTFGHLNLLDEAAVAQVEPVDCIFCRNVLIYFDLPARRRVLESFHRRLRPGGWLLLGHSESLLNVTADFEAVQLEGDLAYRKPGGAP
jgi:chemotaxis protein methyltransferase CheR